MKKTVFILLLAILLIGLGACGGGGTAPADTNLPAQTGEQADRAETPEQEPEQAPDTATEPESGPFDLVGVWDWEEMEGAIILHADGGYSWLGVDYGAQGFEWSAAGGMVSFSLAGMTTEWFSYQVIDANTISIEYLTTPGISYTMRRRTTETLSEAFNLVGTWDWEEMEGAIILHADGGYSWLGVDYGAQGFVWSAAGGMVSFSLAGVATEWFSYQVIDANTISIEYLATPGISYTMRRRTTETLSEAFNLVGTWDWEEMEGAIILHADGGYSWLGVDYGAQGFVWSAAGGMVSYSLAGISTEWFGYQVIDANTIIIEYLATPGIIYTMTRRVQ